MHIKDLNIVTEMVTDSRGTYWIARGSTEQGPVLCYGPTRSEAFQYACTAIKEQAQRKYLNNYEPTSANFKPENAVCLLPSKAERERIGKKLKNSPYAWDLGAAK